MHRRGEADFRTEEGRRRQFLYDGRIFICGWVWRVESGQYLLWGVNGMETGLGVAIGILAGRCVCLSASDVFIYLLSVAGYLLKAILGGMF